jgi:hypothetical protein
MAAVKIELKPQRELMVQEEGLAELEGRDPYQM